MLATLGAPLLCYLSVQWIYGLVIMEDNSSDSDVIMTEPTQETISNGHDSPTTQATQEPIETIPNGRQSPPARSLEEGTSNGRHSPTAHSTPHTDFSVWEKLGSPRLILAPMVDASELPWRLLSRRYGAQLCYTPMVAAHQFVVDKKLRAEIMQSTPEDRPLIVQFCGNDAKNLTAAAKLAEPHCDGIDINIGCPQMVAKRGHYGAYLQDEWPLLTELVSTLRASVSVPISCKIRIYSDFTKTVEYARMLEKAGCQVLAVHGRTVDQRGMNTGLASWEHITQVRKSVSIPVIANGNIQCLTDVHRCLEETGVAGIMTAEGNLYNPALFTGEVKPAWELATEYLDLVDQYPVRMVYVRGHVFNICHHLLCLPENCDIRFLIGKTNHQEDLRKAVNILRERFLGYHEGEKVWNPPEPYDYNLKLPPWICQPYVRPTTEERELKLQNKPLEQKLRGYSVAREKKKRKAAAIENQAMSKRKKPDICNGTKNKQKCCNPRGLTCEHHLCRTCCKSYCVSETQTCFAHKHFISKEVRLEHENRTKNPGLEGEEKHQKLLA
uniref:tRNA-dihydrouridine(16/17) synthase [NAD(P)(+)] n=1 Tax=Cacopsylla melanoneura TaxID=428564 RepID=A0A8D8Y8B8_9HEMI